MEIKLARSGYNMLAGKVNTILIKFTLFSATFVFEKTSATIVAIRDFAT